MSREITMSAQAAIYPFPNSPSENSPVPQLNWNETSKSEHFVQFYEKDVFLIESLAGFIGAGLRKGETVIVIATKAHRDAIHDRLLVEGLDLHAARVDQQFIALDAAQTLAQFMGDGMPDERLFSQVVGGLLERASRSLQPIRAFGEMVALLWQEGNTAAAVRLEELWNDLARSYSFSLFCAYPMKDCCGEKNGEPFLHVCKAHTRVIPSENYTSQPTPDDRLRAITLLQQRAASLEAEISERKQIQHALACRERELSDFVENATEPIHKIGPDGRIMWANKAELEFLGYSAEEYIRHHISEFHADPEVISDILQRLSRGEQLHDYEARLTHKDGSIRFVSINSSVYWEGDKFLHTKCFSRDITQRKLAAELLEKTVAERTEQLRETVAELEAFSYSLSHDMRSPLRAMQGYAKGLIEEHASRLDPEAVLLLKRIERASQRLDMLVRDVLSYTRVGRGDLELRAIHLGELIDDLISDQPEFDGMRQSITIERPLHPVLGHEACLIQCVTNLLANALKFVHPGATPQIRIHTEDVGEKIRVWVVDNGIGIAPEHRDRIFQIFGRIYPEKRFPGTGIGLAIAKKAVTRMGGEIGFESEPGKGSSFWFTLPNPAHAH